jgi:ectoine hydroxylase-related dioxygenase (phytanoyl-CoA dioxygenase family)
MDISFKTNPDEALAWYEENGYFIEKSAFSPAECDALIAAGMELPEFKAGNFRPAMHPHRQESLFLKTMADPRLVDTIELMVGGKPGGLQTEFFYGKRGVKGFSRHQDNFFVEAPGDAFASAWIALVDTGPENGGLTGYPGSHKEGRLPVRKVDVGAIGGQDPNANNEETVVPDKYKEVDLFVPRGSIVYLHSYFVHGSRMNTTDKLRFVLLCTYLREGESFRPGTYAQREMVAL